MRATKSAPRAVSAGDARVLQRNRWYAGLPADIQQEVAQAARVARHPAHALVYEAASPPSGIYIVVAGEIGLEHTSRSGKHAFYHSHLPGEMFGVLSELDGTPRFSDARALVDSSVLNLPHAACQDLMRRSAAVRDGLVRAICESLHVTLDMLVEQHSAPPRAQVAALLVSIFGRQAGDAPEMARLTHGTIAAMAGISRQTAAKILHEFHVEGWIELQYGKLRPRDLPRLQALARR